jgi:hypothetical protein
MDFRHIGYGLPPLFALAFTLKSSLVCSQSPRESCLILVRRIELILGRIAIYKGTRFYTKSQLCYLSSYLRTLCLDFMFLRLVCMGKAVFEHKY